MTVLRRMADMPPRWGRGLSAASDAATRKDILTTGWTAVASAAPPKSFLLASAVFEVVVAYFKN